MTIKFKENDFMKIVKKKLKEEKLTPNKCPEEITFDMLKKEIRPEGEYENNEDNKLALWKLFYMTCFPSNEFGFTLGFTSEEIEKGSIKMPWYIKKK